jgi:hypothetical protein
VRVDVSVVSLLFLDTDGTFSLCSCVPDESSHVLRRTRD